MQMIKAIAKNKKPHQKQKTSKTIKNLSDQEIPPLFSPFSTDNTKKNKTIFKKLLKNFWIVKKLIL